MKYFEVFLSDWKPIVSSQETSYIDFFALDKRDSSFAKTGKSPWMRELSTSTESFETGKSPWTAEFLPSTTEAFHDSSRQERGHSWPASQRPIYTSPGLRPRSTRSLRH